MNNILLYVDEECFSKGALDYTLKIAQQFKAKITILYVQESEAPLTLVGTEVIKKTRGKFQDKENNEILQKAKKYFSDSNLELKTLTSIGNRSAIIINIAEIEKCDAIVIPTPKVSQVKNLLKNNVANRVVNYAKIPVTVVR
ncbi:Nucleotide-binding universal stress protein, UspA family [Desulfonispora thiosulfatigenes DSM 11270]|uniref:Nucleotide-binding universal stress protein, UspA family n=1 Tax=Desulfonispora thiosulfatigenes DSM 11270 TaxID=656914 RepID=A0A1W1V415_DESTI|nr:universal stress protein [Desulfonispora thiosulfatigenes]SMB87794.1 Nucleotide-binding universal stress protein, UspA family [Desulfonispora thiosulfatigenes DSM 11270]